MSNGDHDVSVQKKAGERETGERDGAGDRTSADEAPAPRTRFAGGAYEQNADAVADRVVQGKSAEDLLDSTAGGGKSSGGKAVQCLGYELGKPLPAGAEKPLEEHDDQRRYSVEQYEKMWEAEQGKKLTDEDKKTISRGCIGLTANNLNGGGNPLDSAEAVFADFDRAHQYMDVKNKE